ncbi:hypothetical protein [Nocardia sp. GAS34]|uniref:hypothetical protein n=1 Tax=unclassified Nocardia TaxID=2637762 RepID=UPI003D24D31B
MSSTASGTVMKQEPQDALALGLRLIAQRFRAIVGNVHAFARISTAIPVSTQIAPPPWRRTNNRSTLVTVAESRVSGGVSSTYSLRQE